MFLEELAKILEGDVYLKSCRAPVDKLDSLSTLDIGNGTIDLFGDHVAAVEHTTRYIFTRMRVALDHLIFRTKASCS